MFKMKQTGNSFQHRHIPIRENATLLDMLKHGTYGADWKTETAECGFCHCVLKPPKALVIYNRFDIWVYVPTLFAMWVIDKYIDMFWNTFWLFHLIICLGVFFMCSKLLPALFARFGKWRCVELNGKTRGEYYEMESARVGAFEKSWKYIIPRVIGFIVTVWLIFAR